MLEINDSIRLIKHSDFGQSLWIAQQRIHQRSSYKSEIWTPISNLLTTQQAQYWMEHNNVSAEVVQRFNKT